MKAIDFEYDGKKLSDFGMIICSFDGKGLDTIDNGSTIQFNTVSALGGSKHKLVSTTYEDCLEATIQICKHSCSTDVTEITPSEFRELTRWLNRKKFLKFKILSKEYIDLYFEASFNISRIEINGAIYGLELEVVTNRPFALKEPRVITINHFGDYKTVYYWDRYKISNEYEITKTTVGATVPSDCTGSVYSNYEITDDGNFKLSNVSYLGGYMQKQGTKKSIYYKKMKIGGNTGAITYEYELWTIGDCVETRELIGSVSSDDINSYPDNGIKDGYLYIYAKSESVESGSCYINDTSCEEGYIYPHTEITIVEDGDLNIYNALENRNTLIRNCVAGEVITMDYPIIQTTASSHAIQNDFNWNFFRIANTLENSRNDLTISIPCTIKIKYSPIVKIGL